MDFDHIGSAVVGFSNCGDLSAVAADNPITPTLGSPFSALVSPTIRVVDQPPTSGGIYPQLQRISRHTPAREDCFHIYGMAHSGILHRSGDRYVVAANTASAVGHWYLVAHTLIYHIKE